MQVVVTITDFGGKWLILGEKKFLVKMSMS
jgi:hypothetical protein